MNQYFNQSEPISEFKAKSMSKTFMANVFSYMFLALTVTGISALWVASSPDLVQTFYGTPLRWVFMFAPIIIAVIMGTRFQKMSFTSMMALFFVFSMAMGVSLAWIFMVYNLGTIYATFFITAGTFGAMALLGYTTKTDLTKLGSIAYMALIGLIIASFVNWFMESTQLYYLISYAGVIIFTALTAYDVQKLKRIGMGVEYGTETTKKLVIMGALSLYLDFINLFIFLLRILGSRD